MGNGFLSWKKCSPVNQDVGEAGGPDIKSVTDIDGVTTYQSCTTETPGSVISGTLEKQLGASTDKLVSIKEFSDSIDAIMGALTNQLITKGLSALSGSSATGGGTSYTYVLSTQSKAQQAAQQSDYYNSLNAAANSGSGGGYSVSYGDAINMFSESRSRFMAARSCFANLAFTTYISSTKTYALNQIANIDSIVNNQINPIINNLSAKQAQNSYNYSTPQTFEELQSQVSEFTTSLKSGLNNPGINSSYNTTNSDYSYNNGMMTNTSATSAALDQDLVNASANAARFSTTADSYQSNCNSTSRTQ